MDGRLPQCVARTTASWLLGRTPGDAEQDWVDGLAADFAATGFDYKALVRSIVTDDRYLERR